MGTDWDSPPNRTDPNAPEGYAPPFVDVTPDLNRVCGKCGNYRDADIHDADDEYGHPFTPGLPDKACPDCRGTGEAHVYNTGTGKMEPDLRPQPDRGSVPECRACGGTGSESTKEGQR